MLKIISYSAILFLASLPYAFGQSSQITGRVTDTSGAVVVTAQVIVLQKDTGTRITVTSNQDGYYTVTRLDPGRFELEINHPGFKPVLRSGIVLQVDEVARVDVTLQPGSVSERIVIEGAAPLVESETSDVGQVINNKSIVEMPLNGRSVWDLAKLAGGMVYVSAGGDAGEVPAVSIAGSRSYSQAYELDGGSVQKSGLARAQAELSPMVDAVAEFKIITNNYAAEYGRSAGGVFTAVTRSGTNQFHGNLFEFFRNEVMDARNFFALTRGPLRYNQFGGTLGGPIRKNKTHFFSALEKTSATRTSTVLLTVPTPAQRRGDFSTLVNIQNRAIPLYNPFSDTSGNVLNPNTANRLPFPNNIIPASLLDPVGVKLISYYPDPNVAGNIAGANNRNVNASSQRSQYHGTMKVDHIFGVKDRVFARYVAQNNDTPQASVYPEPAASGLGPVTRNIANLAQTYMASWVRTVTPTLLNDLKWSGTNQHRSIQHASIGGDWPAKLGLTGVGDEAFPRVAPAGYSVLGALQVFREQTNPYWQIQESVSHFRGNHTMKAGFEYRHNRTTDEFDTSPSGNFTVPIVGTGIPGNANTGNGAASLLIGYVSQAALIKSRDFRFHNYSMGMYFQDDWKVTPRLTLNLGIRYDVENGRIADDNMQSAFDMNKINPVAKVPGVITFAGVNGVPVTNYDTDKNNIAPRFGFAWRAFGNDRTVIRGGAGVFFSNPNDQGFNQDSVLGFATNVLLVGANSDASSALFLKKGFTGNTPPTAADRNDGFGVNGPAEFFQRDRAVPYSMQFNLGIQQSMKSVLFSTQYLGNISHKLTANPLSLNQIPASRVRDAGTQQSRRPFPQFTDVTLEWPNLGSSTYHALLLKAEKRYHNGLQFLANYTFSKFIDNVDPIVDFGGTPGVGYSDFYNRGLDKAISPNDIKHLLSFNAIYDLPWGPHRRWLQSGLVSKFLGGWQLSSLGVVRGGPVYGVSTQTNTCNCFSAGPQRPDLLRDPALQSSERDINRWFDLTAFAQPGPYLFGTAARSVGRAPGATTIDFGMNKNFQIAERYRVQFRSEFFNMFNHANFGIPGTTMNTSTFGTITTAADGRVVQLALKVYF